jgi:aspartate aminotransferase
LIQPLNFKEVSLKILDRMVPEMLAITGEDAFRYMVLANEQAEKSGQPVIHTEIGELDFNVPEEIGMGIIESIDDRKNTSYAPSQGLLVERKAAAQYAASRSGAIVTPDQVLITAGAKPNIAAALKMFLHRGRGVAFPDPGYPIYRAMSNLFFGKPYPLTLNPENGFRIDPEEFGRIAPDVDILIINYPHNPTGAVAPLEELHALAAIAIENDVIIISDEAYLEIDYQRGVAPSMLSISEIRSQLIVIQGASKMFAAMGLRNGWGIYPESVIKYASTYLGNLYSCCPPIIQRGVASALLDLNKEKSPTSQWLKEMRRELFGRRDCLYSELAQLPGLRCYKPDGAFYLWIDIRSTGLSSELFTKRFLEEYNVSVLPGNSFGPAGEGYIRLCYGKITIADIPDIVARFKSFLEVLQVS